MSVTTTPAGASVVTLSSATHPTAPAPPDGRASRGLRASIRPLAPRVLGVRTVYVSPGEPGADGIPMRAGIGVMADSVGFELPIGMGIGGEVYRTGRPFVVDDYDAFAAGFAFAKEIADQLQVRTGKHRDPDDVGVIIGSRLDDLGRAAS